MKTSKKSKLKPKNKKLSEEKRRLKVLKKLEAEFETKASACENDEEFWQCIEDFRAKLKDKLGEDWLFLSNTPRPSSDKSPDYVR